MAYQFIEKYPLLFGVRWLLRHLHIDPNAYYNYHKHRKSAYHAQKSNVQIYMNFAARRHSIGR